MTQVKEYLEFVLKTPLNPPISPEKVSHLKSDIKDFLTTFTSFTVGDSFERLHEQITYNIETDEVTHNSTMYHSFQTFIQSIIQFEIFFILDVLKIFMDNQSGVPMYSDNVKEIQNNIVFYSCDSSDTSHHGDLMFAIKNVDTEPIKVVINNTIDMTIEVGDLIWLPLYFANDPETAYSLVTHGKAITYHVLFGMKLSTIRDYSFLNYKLFKNKNTN